ncbi:MAG: hypothetical protein J0L70_30175 [Leptolyngbya sp. UWPOB_LEPTO1]|uniref:DUF6932 family protein n=1 Tax=Leptolyngbya sp. UWPOB_LEPTO1 TaxID=2815653 RepID=UPI001AC8DA34|nr:hypothetical protein [Leptolyngbya sp. UWPOB_LEPTO1]MBN8564802.1 hypothetical protein [Leptolyngbya sp. UWPOB_LEPTO1]
MIPPFNQNGLLPPGIHPAESWQEFAERFGHNSHRQKLLSGMKSALDNLRRAYCQVVYVDGSFVTTKEYPTDFDICWDMTNVDLTLLDPLLLKFDNGRIAQKVKYLGELFPAQTAEGVSGRTFLEFFQIDKVTGNPKGIVALKLWEIWS